MTELIVEGLRRGDLKQLVEPLLSIDEYESKLGEDSDVIVVAFFVADEDPAIDLSKFIEHGHNAALDCEVSPAPNEDGFYLVFVEFSRSDSFSKEMGDVLEEIKGLVEIEEWEFKPYRHNKPVPLTDRNIERYIRLDKNEILRREKEKENTRESRVADFLQPSALDGILQRGELLEIRSYRGSAAFRVVDFGETDKVVKRQRLQNSAVTLHENWLDTLQNWLGDGWWVNRINSYIALSRRDDDNLLLLQET